MQIDAIYDQGRLEFQRSLTLKHQRFLVRVEIPDQEIANPTLFALPTYDLANFSPEIRAKVESMAAVVQDARCRFLPPTDGEESEEERQRWAAMELRLAARREQGRLP
ncbi:MULTISPECIES: hypothetical protein [Thiorhodovibrio]|uniref:hypothetical protein n=1 Tax=Thiorhodovibrio TaxID=61593 RepID=UPI001914BB75|nr:MULTISPECIES: hypothetical protein [Thiorhodovibrio]MBK5970198.1 hypothetical protein [Thiorhodovibrio winogradskyi]WPL13845.1 hypothetical protein Thiosp_03665 [Thiorhodovibrio litoralis]